MHGLLGCDLLGSSTGSVVVVHGLHLLCGRGIFPGHVANACLLRWQVGSESLSHLGSPEIIFLKGGSGGKKMDHQILGKLAL